MHTCRHFAAALAAFLALGGPAGAADFTWASASDALSMDPQAANDVVSASVQGAVYEPLVGFSPQLQPEPVLATSWERLAPDRWRFHLRPGVRFTEGQPFTAADVVFTVTRGLSDTADTRQELTSIKGAVAVDDLTVDIVTKGPDPILPRELNFVRIMSKDWAEAHGDAKPADMRARAESYATRHADGTGPYVLVTREPDSQTVFAPNPGWWAGKPALDRLTFRPLADDATRMAALLSGALDMTDAVPVQDVARVEASPGLKLLKGPELRTVFLGFDQGSPELAASSVKGRNPFKDERVRRAFYLAIDDNAITARVLRGFGRPIGTLVAPEVAGFSPAADKRPPFDPEAAKALLAEAGYPDGFDLGMDCPNNRYMSDAAVCQAVAGMLARVGIRITLNTMPKAQYFPKLFAGGASFWMFGWIPTTYDAMHILVNCTATRDPAANQGAFNFGRFSDPEVDALIVQARTELDEAKRTALMGQALTLAAADVPYIPLYQQSLLWAVRNGVDATQTPDGVVQVKWIKVSP